MNRYEITGFDLKKKKRAKKQRSSISSLKMFSFWILLERLNLLTNLGLFEVCWSLSHGYAIWYHYQIVEAQVTVVLTGFVKSQDH